jgi:anti-sigma B factor antagonist
VSSFYISDATMAEGMARGEAAVLVGSGEIDYEASPQLKALINDYIKAGTRRVVLDLSSATFIDSTAIGVLVGAVTKLQQAGGGSLAVVCTHEKVLQIFEIAGLDSMISLHRSREEALFAHVRS